MRALAHERATGQTDREVARHCGVSHPFVIKLREESVGNGYQPNDQDPTTPPEKRTGKDGKSYKAKKPKKPVVSAEEDNSGPPPRVEREEAAYLDVIFFSVGSNALHGKPRSNADKRHSVLTLLNDPEWSVWSDSEIARRCAVAQTTVMRTRSESVSHAKHKIADEPRRVSRGGTEYVQKTANIGKCAIPGLPSALSSNANRLNERKSPGYTPKAAKSERVSETWGAA